MPALTQHRQTIDYLKEENIKLMSHCPYSPDLSPNDFFLFPNVKKKMRGQLFSSPQEAVESFQNHISEVPTSEWKNKIQTPMKSLITALINHK